MEHEPIAKFNDKAAAPFKNSEDIVVKRLSCPFSCAHLVLMLLFATHLESRGYRANVRRGTPPFKSSPCATLGGLSPLTIRCQAWHATV